MKKSIQKLLETSTLPMVVCRTVWNDPYQYPVVVTEIELGPFGKCYGFPVNLSKFTISDHFDYCHKYRADNSIPNAGANQWMKWLTVPDFVIHEWIEQFENSLTFSIHNRPPEDKVLYS